MRRRDDGRREKKRKRRTREFLIYCKYKIERKKRERYTEAETEIDKKEKN